jgi:hypothetical protein
MSVNVRNIQYGTEKEVARFYRPTDIFFYDKLKFFAHGDITMPNETSPLIQGINANPPAYGFIRFGVDTSNYYEYRFPLTRGWKSHEISLAELTSGKLTRDSAIQFLRTRKRAAQNHSGKIHLLDILCAETQP